MQAVELLSPAGDIQSVYQAVQNGADAVYIGGKSFGARAFAKNFSDTEMKQVIDYAHVYGIKVYVTANTLVYEHEIAYFLAYIETVYALGADALIMQDVGMMALVKRRFPDIAIHASTQMHNHNDACLCFVSGLGAERAVLAREMRLAEIKALTCDIEKEVFIHGALCICYSGQCLMSTLTKNRSGNRGMCAQSCRMRYRLTDSNGRRLGHDDRYILSPKDLALFTDIEALITSGIHSLKIEGRMKPPEYVGHVTKIYAKLLQQVRENEPIKVDAADIEKLEKLFNRGFTKGHLFGGQDDQLMGTIRPNHRGVPLGRVVSYNRDRIKVKLIASLHQGDGIKFEKSDTGFICNKIYKNGKLVNGADMGDTVELDRKARVEAGEPIVKTSDIQLLKQLQNAGERKTRISGILTARKGDRLTLTVSDFFRPLCDGVWRHYRAQQNQPRQASRILWTMLPAWGIRRTSLKIWQFITIRISMFPKARSTHCAGKS